MMNFNNLLVPVLAELPESQGSSPSGGLDGSEARESIPGQSRFATDEYQSRGGQLIS